MSLSLFPWLAAAWLVCFLCRNILWLNKRAVLPTPVAHEDIFLLEVSGDDLDDAFKVDLEDALCTRGLLHVAEAPGQETVVLRVKEEKLARTFSFGLSRNWLFYPLIAAETCNRIADLIHDLLGIFRPRSPRGAVSVTLCNLLGCILGVLCMVVEFLPKSAWVIHVSVGIERGGAAEKRRRISVSENDPNLDRSTAMNFLRKRLAKRVSQTLRVPPRP